MYNLVNNKANFAIAVPESLDEITPKVLENLTKDIKLPKYYCIIALAYQTTHHHVPCQFVLAESCSRVPQAWSSSSASKRQRAHVCRVSIGSCQSLHRAAQAGLPSSCASY